MYDVIIVGAGPAGLTAAIYVRRAGRSALLLEAKMVGGQIVNTPEIENYPGLKKVSGFDFTQTLFEQATAFGAEIAYETVTSVEKDGDVRTVRTASGKTYQAKAVILATGAKNRHLGLAREDELLGHGISYCATCDGMFFKGKEVAVNGGGSTAVGDALFLSNGPGDPALLQNAVAMVRSLIGTMPVVGICLGHQLITWALGGTTVKMKFGHHGGNEPVYDHLTGRTFVTSQNHGFMSDPDSLPKGVKVWYTNANDGSIEGLIDEKRKVASVQFHPEASPGPHDAAPIFDRFVQMGVAK